jgi:regulator of protease activity HflC (stomatin/prohibitin superfamily)
MEPKRKLLLGLVGVIIALFAFLIVPKLVEDIAAGEIAVIQSPVSGELAVVTSPGWAWQGGGTVTTYKRSNQLWFSNKEGEGDGAANSGAIKIGFNDFGEGTVSGSVRWYMPTDKESVLKLHSDYGTQESIEFKLIKQAVTKAIYMSGPLMSSKEAVSEKKTALLSYTEDQANNGIYKTRAIPSRDTLSDTNSKLLEIVYKDGKPQITKASDVATYGIQLSNFTINEILFSETVTKQISDQQKLVMAVQTSKANAQKAVQDAITTKANGEANAAKAKWEQEVIKAKLVTQAEAAKDVAQLSVQTAALNKQRDILEGEGIAAKKRLVMQADGALTQKLATYEKVQGYWANAFQNYGGSLVPTYVSGGAGSGNAGFNFMELMSAKAAKDLGLELQNKRK